MAENKAKRLSKVAREFNVGISTIVEFLQKKGHEIESNPNTKVSNDLYAVLLQEYKADINVKKESEKVNLKSLRQKQETVSVSGEAEKTEKPAEKEEKEITIKDSGLSKKTEVKEEKAFKTSKPETDVSLKVVGKIDLEKKEKEKAKAEEPKKEESSPAKEEKPQKPVVDSSQKKKTEETKPEPQEKKKEMVKEEKPEEKKSETPEKKEAQVKKEEKVETPSEEKGENRIKENVKVVGKIDLSTLNQKTRPAKKTRKQKEEERKARIEGQKKDGGQGSEVYKSGVKKLNGPTVVGKIDLPKDKKAAGSADADKKKKRKRIKKDGKVDVNKPNAQRGGDNRPGQQGGQRGGQQGGKFKKGQKGKRPVRQEVSEEDVQKQIKDTLARLTSKGGKSKGSKHRREKRDEVNRRSMEELERKEAEKNVIKVTEFVSVNELATMMDVTVTDVISTCMSLGLFVSINQRLDAETMGLVADEFNYEVEFISVEVQEAIKEEEDKEEDLLPRSPIVTVMGHVDHGKTSLLDHIRKANVIAGEAGGITQHIGAYSVEVGEGKKITFLDTPGHEAFTAMRARGAQVTDIAIIVVAADDSVMPQTVEAINHAQAAGVPIVFAINKIDKPGANPDKIKEALANMNLLVEEWGGKYQSQDISAKNGINIEELLEKVLLEAEMLELKANPDKKATGTVIESELDKGRGYVSTILVEAGTLRVGDILIAGSYHGHVKAMYNERGKRIEEAGPATPVQILGLNGAPQAGDKFNEVESDKEAKQIANKREQLQREQGLRTNKHITLEEIGRRIAIGNFQELNVIVKGDVDGSIEALSDSLIKLSTDEIQVNIKHKAVGQISESDVLLAAASNAIIVGFQVRPSMSARKLAEKEEIDIRLYSIIYDAINELKDAMEGMLSPDIKEEIVGTAEIRETFKISKVGTIAGCIVREGKIKRNNKVRIIRDGIVVYSGELGSLKRFKDDAKEVAHGYECGLNIENFNDIKVGDVVESYEEVEVKKTL